MRWDYPSLDINPVFPGLGELINLIITVIIIIIIIIITIIILGTNGVGRIFIVPAGYSRSTYFYRAQVNDLIVIAM